MLLLLTLCHLGLLLDFDILGCCGGQPMISVLWPAKMNYLRAHLAILFQCWTDMHPCIYSLVSFARDQMWKTYSFASGRLFLVVLIWLICQIFPLIFLSFSILLRDKKIKFSFLDQINTASGRFVKKTNMDRAEPNLNAEPRLWNTSPSASLIESNYLRIAI